MRLLLAVWLSLLACACGGTPFTSAQALIADPFDAGGDVDPALEAGSVDVPAPLESSAPVLEGGALDASGDAGGDVEASGALEGGELDATCSSGVLPLDAGGGCAWQGWTPSLPAGYVADIQGQECAWRGTPAACDLCTSYTCACLVAQPGNPCGGGGQAFLSCVDGNVTAGVPMRVECGP